MEAVSLKASLSNRFIKQHTNEKTLIDDSDVEKIVAKLDAVKKERSKKESRDMSYLLAGLIAGLLLAALVIGTFPTEKIANQSSPTEQEILKIQDLSCFELRHFTPKYANPEFVTLEILQRCVE